ncbi:MAG: sulfatase-like hydrolase/transferase, partial [Phycisphaeraceae bacterium]|nr:sulfatase-like hydrolase/transferase [Phycisphaeraceae bacterium]
MFRSILSFAIFGFWVASVSAAPTGRNFVVVVVDDLGWVDLACYGSKVYETPNLDALAARGVRFTNGYASHPVCSPTRAALMTGKNPARKEINITNWIPGGRKKIEKLIVPELADDLPLEETTVAERLKAAGYSTWFLGKWHLGHDAAHWPEAHGFDVNVGGWSVGSPRGGYYAPYKNPRLKSGPKGEYLPDRLTDEAIALLEKRDRAKPFLLYLSYYTVHTPIQASKRHIDHYRQKIASMDFPGPLSRPEGRGATRLRQSNAARS